MTRHADEIGSITFAEIEKSQGVQHPTTTPYDDYPLPAWYLSVRDKPLRDFTDEDLSTACWENFHPEYIVPIALLRLQENPLAGDLYEGQLLASLKGILNAYWLKHSDQCTHVKKLVDESIDRFESEDTKQKVRELQALLEALLGPLGPPMK